MAITRKEIQKHFEIALDGIYQNEDDMLVVFQAMIKAATGRYPGRDTEFTMSAARMQLVERAIALIKIQSMEK